MNHEISLLSATQLESRLGELAILLSDCVAAGAAVNFVVPFSPEQAEAFWRDKVLPPLREGSRAVLIAERKGRIVGTVQLDTGMPPNQPHRAEVGKLLVHPEARRQGIARALMEALERLAAARGRSLLTLDTRTGDDAEPLYRSLGYIEVGRIPDFSQDPLVPTRLNATTLMYKKL